MELTRAQELDLSRQFGFYVVDREDRFEAVSYFHIRRQDNWGMYLILLLALFPVHQMIYNGDLFVRIFCGVLGIGLGGFALLGLLKTATDHLVVTKDRVTFRNSLVRRSIPVQPGMKIQMRTDAGVFKRKNSLGYPYFHIEIWMLNGSNEHRIFDYGGHQKERVLLERLGKQVRATINRHIQ